MQCSRCGRASEPGQKFCVNCGALLEAAPVAQSAAQTPAPPPEAVPQPPAAPLTPIPAGGFTIADIVAWLQSAGYAAKVVTGPSGDPHVESKTQGITFNIFTGDSKGDRCASLEIAAGISMSGNFDIAHINEWNSKNRWCRAYYDSVNDPWLEMDIDLWPGGTYESLNDQFAAWNATLGRFIAKYNLR